MNPNLFNLFVKLFSKHYWDAPSGASLCRQLQFTNVSKYNFWLVTQPWKYKKFQAHRNST
eukprot:UN10774